MARLSVLIPAYNPDAWLVRILRSLDAQRVQFPDIEVIVADDCSTNGFDWSGLPVDKYIRHAGNVGEGLTRNTLLNAASGEWFVFIDADDEISDNYLATVFRNMERGYDWVSYDWTCDGSRNGAYQNHDSLMVNCAVWAYSFRNHFYGNEMFNDLRLGCDTDWLGRVLKPEHKHFHDSTVIYNYRWNGNDNSLCHRKLRGEISQ